ncbi:hypothetical protein LTR10_019723 [Elasticomyces elasticus]|uniref:Uncharacterized protein n=1 Tax=Exophiala sideris TaxID=1016849 RepID=A0ABR0JM54_9EURO|nr:hypothetical protein LTR10_019723 [Elasticomyces elasticus]KAK5032143.1 hypothetical protein LTR13_007360 [Exophiala sideris]KAK5036141.1 hypothetical protein LTS07_001866 [Exophiala sideris]KAK5066524.1 hypothetical protein LTR69_001870 [Exophiala sideris]KAK5180346.1 hypothetical protein LTR44_007103 [Eurotiomycetes sp. CCFEE 6388]
MAPPGTATNILFVPYQRPTAGKKTKQGSGNGDEISPQKHAAREYHRKAKIRQLADPGTLHKRHSHRKHTTQRRQPSGDDQHRITSPHSNKESVPKETKQHNHLSTIDPGAGHLDPFNIVLPHNVPSYALDMLDYGATILQSGITLCLLHYPPVIPAEQPALSTGSGPASNTVSAIGNLRDVVLACAMHSPASFYTIALAGATHKSYSSDASHQIKILRLSYTVQAVKELNHELQTLTGDPADALLFCISLLAAHASAAGGDQMRSPMKEETQSPLATAQSQYYGSLRWEDAHMKAIRLLVERKGGIHKVKLPGIANVLGLADIFMSWLTLRRPAFALLAPTSLVLSTFPSPPSTIPSSLANMTQGFRALSESLTSMPLFGAIDTIRLITIGYDMYLSQQPLAPSLVKILWARNSATHDLLSLSNRFMPDDSQDHSEIDTTDTEGSQALYSLIRLSTLAYTLLVLFPMPRVAGLHANLSKQIRSALKVCAAMGFWDENSSLLLWATLVGGSVGDMGEPVRGWFMDVLTKHSPIRCRTASWPAVRDIVTRYLWFDGPECEGVGSEVWMEACKGEPEDKSDTQSAEGHGSGKTQ